MFISNLDAILQVRDNLHRFSLESRHIKALGLLFLSAFKFDLGTAVRKDLLAMPQCDWSSIPVVLLNDMLRAEEAKIYAQHQQRAYYDLWRVVKETEKSVSSGDQHYAMSERDILFMKPFLMHFKGHSISQVKQMILQKNWAMLKNLSLEVWLHAHELLPDTPIRVEMASRMLHAMIPRYCSEISRILSAGPVYHSASKLRDHLDRDWVEHLRSQLEATDQYPDPEGTSVKQSRAMCCELLLVINVLVPAHLSINLLYVHSCFRYTNPSAYRRYLSLSSYYLSPRASKL